MAWSGGALCLWEAFKPDRREAPNEKSSSPPFSTPSSSSSPLPALPGLALSCRHGLRAGGCALGAWAHGRVHLFHMLPASGLAHGHVAPALFCRPRQRGGWAACLPSVLVSADAAGPAVPLDDARSCSHVFCEACLAEWFRRAQRCPMCNRDLSSGACVAPLRAANPLAHRILLRIRVRCPLHRQVLTHPPPPGFVTSEPRLADATAVCCPLVCVGLCLARGPE